MDLERLLGFGEFNTGQLTCSATMAVTSAGDRFIVTVPLPLLEITTPGKGTKLVALVNSVSRFQGHGDDWLDCYDFHPRFGLDNGGDKSADPTDYSVYQELLKQYFASIMFGHQEETEWTTELNRQLAEQSEAVYAYHEQQVQVRYEARKKDMRDKATATRAANKAHRTTVSDARSSSHGDGAGSCRDDATGSSESPDLAVSASSSSAGAAAAAAASPIRSASISSSSLSVSSREPAATAARYVFGQSRRGSRESSKSFLLHLDNLKHGDDAAEAVAASSALDCDE